MSHAKVCEIASRSGSAVSALLQQEGIAREAAMEIGTNIETLVRCWLQEPSTPPDPQEESFSPLVLGAVGIVARPIGSDEEESE